MITVIVIPTDPAEPLRLEELDELRPDGFRRLVGGYLEVVSLQHPTADLYLNEEGKLLGLPLNLRATLLVWVHNTAFIGRDRIVGAAVIVGPPDRDGNDQSAPRELIDLLLNTTRYQVQAISASTGEQATPEVFSTWADAYTEAITLARQSPVGTRVQVVPAPASGVSQADDAPQ